MLSEDDVNRIADAIVKRMIEEQRKLDDEFHQRLSEQGINHEFKYSVQETPKETPEEFWLKNELKKFEKLKAHALKYEHYEKIPEYDRKINMIKKDLEDFGDLLQ